MERQGASEGMDPDAVEASLNFHGQQLARLWENEAAGIGLQLSALKNVDYQVFKERSKYLEFQDRAKRVMVHQFIVDKARYLFAADEKDASHKAAGHRSMDEGNHLPLLPPFEFFNDFEKSDLRANFFKSIKVGDTIIGQVQQKSFHGLTIRVMASDCGTCLRDLRDLSIRASVPPEQSDRKEGALASGDLVRCEVVEVYAESEKIVCGFRGVCKPRSDLGIIRKEELPQSYRILTDTTPGTSYEDCLKSNRQLQNPNAIEHSAQSLNLEIGTNSHTSMLAALNCPLNDKDYASELRKMQNAKWALKSVAEGIKYFKTGQETEAFQCLNKALHIDPINVEGLVARGALYANKGSYEKAIVDFETALAERPGHANATNYLSETLVAYGKQYEDEKNPEEALRLYHKCLNIAPNHKEARSSIQALSKSRQKPNFNIDFLENGAAAKNGAGGGGDDSAGQAAAAGDLQDGGAGGQKVKERHRKRTTSSSSSSSSSSSASRFSSSDSNSSAARSRRKKKKSSKSSRSKKEASLSPFSKKMAQLNPLENPLLQPDSALPAAPFYPLEAPHPVPAPQFPVAGVGGNPPAPGVAFPSAYTSLASGTSGYSADFMQRAALNQGYEKKVEMFLQQVGKGKETKEKEKERSKDKKKKKKKGRSKDKKKKKDSKRDKGKDKKHRKKKKTSDADEDDSDKDLLPSFTNLDEIGELGELEAKMSAYYAKLTSKESKKKRSRRRRHSSDSTDSSDSTSDSSSESDLERKKRKAKKALEALAATAELLRERKQKLHKIEPVTADSVGGVFAAPLVAPPVAPQPAAYEEEDSIGKWRPMALKVKLGGASDEPEVEESRMVYMKDDKKMTPVAPVPPPAPLSSSAASWEGHEFAPGEDKVSFQIKPFGLFGPGGVARATTATNKSLSPAKEESAAAASVASKASAPAKEDEEDQVKERGAGGGRSRSRSRRRSYSRSASRGRSYSRSYSRSRSPSPRGRRRSRSHSNDGRRHTQRYRGNRNHNAGHYNNNRNNRYPQRGGYQNRNRGWHGGGGGNRGNYNNRPHRNYGGNNNQGYDNRRQRGRNRGGYWQQQLQRSYSRSRSRSRSYSRSRSVSRSRSRSGGRADRAHNNNNDAGGGRRSRSRTPVRDRSNNNEASSQRRSRSRSAGRAERAEKTNRAVPTATTASSAFSAAPAPVVRPSSPAAAIEEARYSAVPNSAAPAPAANIDRRKIEGKWGYDEDDDDEDLVPPGCE